MVDGCRWHGFSLSIKYSRESVTGFLLSISAPASTHSASGCPWSEVDYEDQLAKVFWDVVELCASNPGNIWIPPAWVDAWGWKIFGVAFAADGGAILDVPAPRRFYAHSAVSRRQSYIDTLHLLHRSVPVSWTPIAQNQSLRQRVQYNVNAYKYPKGMSHRGNRAQYKDQ